METLKSENTQLKKNIRELKSENGKLQNKIAKLEAHNVTLRNRVKVLEKERGKVNNEPLNDLEVARRLKFLFAKITRANYTIIGPDGKPIT